METLLASYGKMYLEQNTFAPFGGTPVEYLVIALAVLIVIVALEFQFCVFELMPSFIPLVKTLFSKKPYQNFGQIADNCVYSRKNYSELVNDPSADLQYSYDRLESKRFNRQVSRLATLKIANRILEFRLWLKVRDCSSYEQLLEKAVAFIQETGQNNFVFISSPLTSHVGGMSQGIKELRKAIIEAAELHQGRVFNQIPFLDIYLPRMKNEIKNKLETFYGPIISSSFIYKLKMNFGYERSTGCLTELAFAQKSAKIIEY